MQVALSSLGIVVVMLGTAYLALTVVVHLLRAVTWFSGIAHSRALYYHAFFLAALVLVCENFAPTLMRGVYIGFRLAAVGLALFAALDALDKRRLGALAPPGDRAALPIAGSSDDDISGRRRR